MSIDQAILNEFKKFMECISEAGCMNDIIVVGSWAEYIYSKSKLLDYEPEMNTKDLDFLIPNIRKPRKQSNLVEVAKEKGFLYEENRVDGISRFIGRGNFEVEFLAQQKGDGSQALPKTNIGVNAQQLTHMSVLINNTVVLDYEGLAIIVPTPEAYVIQKMIINGKRGIKAEKDRRQINSLVGLIDQTEFIRIIDTLTKKEQKYVNQYESDYL